MRAYLKPTLLLVASLLLAVAQAEEKSLPVAEQALNGQAVDSLSLDTLSLDNEQWAGQYQQAEWVALVRIGSVGGLVHPALSMEKGMYGIQAYRYTAYLLRDWKGGLEQSFNFRVDLSHCTAMLALDKEYLVFGVTDLRGNRQVMSCTDLVPRADMEAKLVNPRGNSVAAHL